MAKKKLSDALTLFARIAKKIPPAKKQTIRSGCTHVREEQVNSEQAEIEMINIINLGPVASPASGTVHIHTAPSGNQYIRKGNTLKRVDGDAIPDEDIGTLREISYERAAERNAEPGEITEAADIGEELSHEFWLEHSDKIEKLDDAFFEAYSGNEYEKAIITLDTIKDYCSMFGRGGYIYYMQNYEWLQNSSNPCFSYRDSINDHIIYDKKHKEIASEIAKIMIDSGKMLQKDLWRKFPENREIAQRVTEELVGRGFIKKEKQGRLWMLSIENKTE